MFSAKHSSRVPKEHRQHNPADITDAICILTNALGAKVSPIYDYGIVGSRINHTLRKQARLNKTLSHLSAITLERIKQVAKIHSIPVEDETKITYVITQFKYILEEQARRKETLLSLKNPKRKSEEKPDNEHKITHTAMGTKC